MQANLHAGSDDDTTEDDAPRRTRGRPSRHAAKRPVRQRRLPYAEDSSRGSGRGGSGEDGLSLTSFLAMIANAAVSVDGLKRVGASLCGTCSSHACLVHGKGKES